MGDDKKTPFKLNFDSKVRLEFRGATITSDAGLLACRELDDALGLTDSTDDFLKESRTGRNILHKLTPLLRQSVFSRLAGYDDTNDRELTRVACLSLASYGTAGRGSNASRSRSSRSPIVSL